MRSALAQESSTAPDAGNEIAGGLMSEAMRILELGGPVVAILFAISVAGLAIAFYKWLQFSAASTGRFRRLHKSIDQWNSGSKNEASDALEKNRFALASHVLWALKRAGDTRAELVREELQRRGANFISPYERFLSALELIYYLAPVLGLLGTVLGMIEAFRGLESSGGSGDSSVLAGGIWEALLTTAVGLSIAIPFAVIHSILEARLTRIVEQVNDVLTRALTGALSDSDS